MLAIAEAPTVPLWVWKPYLFHTELSRFIRFSEGGRVLDPLFPTKTWYHLKYTSRMWVLRTFWFQQDWYDCAEGYPLAELYFAMVLETGWLTPVNVASWDQTTLPHCWRSKLLTAFVHELDFSGLKFNRPCFWKQFTTFQFAVKAL